jgi:hypothetical protein
VGSAAGFAAVRQKTENAVIGARRGRAHEGIFLA